jgi:hypothetical protein
VIIGYLVNIKELRKLPAFYGSQNFIMVFIKVRHWTWPELPEFFLISIVGGGVHTGSTRHVGYWMGYCTCPSWLWWWRIWWNEDGQGKPKYSEKTCPSATLSTTNSTWLGPGSNPGRRGGKPATNRLSYGVALLPEFISHLHIPFL